MDERKLSYADAAKLMGVSREYIRQQANLVKISVEAALKISRALEIDPSEFRPDAFLPGEVKFLAKQIPQ
ncbi:MAG: helix-turn-helix transcriptional regulator [Chitinivibrionia bacterium]|nr:helix-turn-helix transcriptional regulator [Chitinivibrionia bacterium]